MQKPAAQLGTKLGAKFGTVQSLADAEWRLLRSPTLESGIYALGRREIQAERQEALENAKKQRPMSLRSISPALASNFQIAKPNRAR
jgi:hypothetical protein